MTVEELAILVTMNDKNLQKQVDQVNSKLLSMDKVARKSSDNIVAAAVKIGKGFLALKVVQKVMGVIKNSIHDAFEYIAGDQVYLATMGEFSGEVAKLTTGLKTSLGISRSEMRKFISTMYNVTTSMGIGSESAYKMSTSMSMLAQDMAAFWNISAEDALGKLQSGLSGNAIALKELGVVVNDTMIKQTAYNSGIAKQGANLSEAQKVAARYVTIMNQTGNVQGFLAKTIESPNAQFRMLKDMLHTVSYSLGQLFIPAISAVLPYLNALAKLLYQVIQAIAAFFKINMTTTLNGTATSAGTAAKNVGKLGKNINKATGAAKKFKGALAGFDEMNVLTDNSAGGGGGAGAGGLGGLFDFDVPEIDWSFLETIKSKSDEIADQIKTKFMQVKEAFTQIWDSSPVQAFVGLVQVYLSYFGEFWKQIGINIWNNLVGIWKNIQPDVETGIKNMLALFTTMFNDLNFYIQFYGQQIINGVNGILNSIISSAFAPFATLLGKMWAGTWESLKSIWDKHGKNLLKNIGDFVINSIALFQKLWDSIIAPIIQPFMEALSWLWDNCLKQMTEELGNFIMRVINGALEIYNILVVPIISWLSDLLAPGWAKCWGNIADGFKIFVFVIAGLATEIFKILGGIVDFITGVFTGNWEKAWKGVKDIFGFVVKGLAAIFKEPINGLIDIVNKFIKQINKIKIPDWVPGVGGKSINIQPLQKLARGGVVNNATVAMLGEAGKEVVMPLERNTGWIDDLAVKIGDIIGTGGEPIHITVNVGSEKLVDQVIDGVNDKIYRTGELVFNV